MRNRRGGDYSTHNKPCKAKFAKFLEQVAEIKEAMDVVKVKSGGTGIAKKHRHYLKLLNWLGKRGKSSEKKVGEYRRVLEELGYTVENGFWN